MSIWSEIKKPFKKVTKEVFSRTYKTLYAGQKDIFSKRSLPYIGAAAGYLIAGPVGGVAGTGGTAATGLSAGTLAGIGAGVGYVAGGGLTMKVPSLPPLPPPSPIITTAGYAGQAEKDRRKRLRGYGSSILAGGELGAASTRRRELGP